ncbi:MAG: GNAT family N-acetyltransferase [Phototrophicaceae bacterium]
MTIRTLNFTNDALVQRALTIQKLAYRIEADLIGFDGIPQLHQTIQDLRTSEETFIGYFVDEVLAGMLSYSIDEHILDIGRLVIHPDYFRRGIARQLVDYALAIPDIKCWEVATGASNHPARRLYEGLGFDLIEEISLSVGVTIARYAKE